MQFICPPSSLATLKVNVAMITLFALLDLTFLLLACHFLTGHAVLQKVGGSFGIATAAVAFYAGAAQLLTEDNCWFTLPVGRINSRRRLD